MNLTFSKYEGAGNDFIIVDDRPALFSHDNIQFIQELCHRQKGIGADGVILLQESQTKDADFRMRIFNSDGSEASMCGNGLRCLVHYIHEIHGMTIQKIESAHRIHLCEVTEKGIWTELGSVKKLMWDFDFEGVSSFWVHTGVPHFVQIVTDLHLVDVFGLGQKIRHDTRFSPQGTNVNFAEIKEDRVLIRTYERGVEGETLACGTGAAAVGYVVAQLKQKENIVLETRSKSVLQVKTRHDEIFLQGPARKVFRGTMTRKNFH